MSDGRANESVNPGPQAAADGRPQLAEFTPIRTGDREAVRHSADGQSPSLSPAAKAFLSRMPIPQAGAGLPSEAAPSGISGVDKSRLRLATDIIARRGPVHPGFPTSGPWGRPIMRPS